MACVVLFEPAFTAIGEGHSGRSFVLFMGVATSVMDVLAWWTSRSRSILAGPLPVAFALAMGTAWVTASLGMHAVFGLLLPLFFASTGLSLTIDAVSGQGLAILHTRGLTELIALSMGLELGVIGENLFTILVLVALITTLMTGLLLALIKPLKVERTDMPEQLTSM